MKKIAPPFAETFRHFLPLKPYFIQNRWPLAIGLLSLFAVDFLQLLIPLVIKRVFDLLTIKAATAHALFTQGAIILGIALLIAFFRYVWRLLILGHSKKVEENLRSRLYEHLQTLSLSFYHRTKTGDLMAKAINDINAVRMATGMGIVALTDGLILGTAAIGFMLFINVKLTLVSLVPAPIIIVLIRILTRRMGTGFEKVQKTFSDLTETVRETFAGIRPVKAYGRESWSSQRVEKWGKKYIQANMDLAWALALFFPLMAILTNLGLVIVIWLGGRLTILGDITTGDFVAFTSYLNLLTWPMMAIGWVTNLIQRGAASMQRINSILEETPEIKDPARSLPAHKINGKIEFKGLSIQYPGKTDYALTNIRLKIEAGQIIALVGRVGSGKSSLLHLIPRLLEAPPGVLFMDGRDIRQIPLKTLRKNIGFVTQEAFIFSDTIRNNVLFGRRNLSQKNLEAALLTADIFEDIQGFEKGLDTILGERGITLSGGQKQRLAIARALIGAPPILILDDSLSMVDTGTEERILNRMLQTRKHSTTLIVSHRISAISRADRIIMLEQGKIIEEGSHEMLLKKRGTYSRLYEKQLLAEELGKGAD